jgi:hypothetical protein
VFVQTAYLFAATMRLARPPSTTRLRLRACATIGGGFYAGVVGGGDWGRSKHLNNGGGNNNTLANDITSTFHVNGALLGGECRLQCAVRQHVAIRCGRGHVVVECQRDGIFNTTL